MYVSTFYSYKEATRQVTDWIKRHSFQVLQSLQSSDPQHFRHHEQLYTFLSTKAARNRQPLISEYDDMLDAIVTAARQVQHQLQDLPTVLSACDKAIELRTQSNQYHELISGSSDPSIRDSHERHRHFIEAMKGWREKLGNLGHLAQRPASAHSVASRLHVMTVGDVHESSDDESEEEQAEEPSGIHVGGQSSKLVKTATAGNVMQLAHLTVNDCDDIVFVLQCMLVDLEALMRTVSTEWLSVHNGHSNYIQASLATLLALRRVRDLTAQMQEQFPEIVSFEDFCSALAQPEMEADSHGNDWDEGVRVEQQLRKYVLNHEYPDRTLFPVMRGLSVYLRTFTTAVQKTNTQLTLRTGYFGEPYNEMNRQATDFIDFGSRFLLEHLPVMYNEYLEIDEVIRHDSILKFKVFNEVFEEFRHYFRTSRGNASTTIPFVFLITAWYHCVQINQGGLFLSRITAITRKCVGNLVDSMKAHETQHRNLINGSFYDLCAPRLEFLHQRTSLYRNHPFMAGVIALDVAVNVSLAIGRITVPFSYVTHRALHLYNAMVHGGGMDKAPAMEQLMSVHSRAFFLPARPSRNFRDAVKKNCPGIEERKAAKPLYRVLFEKKVDGIEHDSFFTLVKAVQSLWTDDFCERRLFGFDIMKFELAIIPIVNEIGTLVPHLLSWDQIMLHFIKQLDKRILQPDTHQAMRIFSDGLRELNVKEFNLLPRVPGSMQLELFGAPVSLKDDDDSAAQYTLFGVVMNVFEDYSGALSDDEFDYVYSMARKRPGILSVHDKIADRDRHLMCSILNQVAGGKRADVKLLECLMQIDPGNNAAPVTPIHAAAAAGNVDALHLLLSAHNFSQRDLQCEHVGNTPLHYAAVRGHLDTVKYLEKLFVNPNITNNKGETAFDIAKTEVVQDHLMRFHNKHHDEMHRVLAKPPSEARANEQRWAQEAEERSKRLHQKLNKRRGTQEVKPITADQVEKARKAEQELLDMLEQEEREGKKGGKKVGKKSGKKGRKKK